jgi:hypothetical protein
VVCRPDGISDFDRLRAAVGRLGSRNAFLYAFDLLEINGTDLRRDPWQERRTVLVRLLRTTNAKGIRLSDHLDSNGAVAFRHACRMGLEGIVAKRRDRAVSIGTMRRLDQGQEPGGAGCNADHGMVKQRQEAGPPTDLEREYRQPIEDIGRAFKRMKTRDDFALVGRFLMLYYASEKLALGIEGINQNLPADCVFRVGSQPGLTKAEIGCEGIMPANL